MKNNQSIHLSPTSLAQYVRLENCDRFLRFRMVNEDLERLKKKWHLTEQPLTPLLKDAGLEFEALVAERIAGLGEVVVDLNKQDFDETVRFLQNVQSPTILLQAQLKAPLGKHSLSGRTDAVRLTRDKKGRLEVLIADIKASRQERMEHRLQVAIYALMIQHAAQQFNIPLAGIHGTIITAQDDGSLPALGDKLPTFDLDTYYSILDRIIVEDDSVVNRILSQPFEEVFYHLSYKCDGCLYNAFCMFDSAERMDVGLTPHISPVEKRVLIEAGVRTLQDLANLMVVNDARELVPVPDRQDTLKVLKNRWPIAPNLPFLVQRAQAALHNFNREVNWAPFLIGSGFGTLPGEAEHPGLVKVFFDAQHDFLKDRVYMISGLVKGPAGETAVVKMTNQPPTDDDEERILKEWVQEILKVLYAVAGAEQAPVHLYCYNRYDQKVLLEALKRHLGSIAAIPAFFDLMTQSPALSQPMISFLADDVKERKNLGLVCGPLHDVARWLRFDWKDERFDYFNLFRARMFDNRRYILRNSSGNILPVGSETAEMLPGKQRIESASRFNSQIPLEYAYAAWGCLPDSKEDSQLLEPFRNATIESLMGFGRMRTKALAHIESSFQYKARFLKKDPLNLALIQPEAEQGLARSLEEFLFIEHHAKLQTNLLTYSLPVERRMQGGTALLLNFLGKDAIGNAHFSQEFDLLGLEPILTMNGCKIKENDWVVLNPYDPTLSAMKIKNGRLARVVKIGQERVELALMNLSVWKSIFRYPHEKDLEPMRGQLYMIDPMSDDFGSDKILEALKRTQNNVFFQCLEKRPIKLPLQESRQETLHKFTDQVVALLKNQKRMLTAKQMETIAGRLDEPIILVQGPPGTGKSYTLAWAILGQVAAAAVEGRPCRIAISCKTHNAINVEMKAVSEALRLIRGFATARIGSAGLNSLSLYKIVNGPDDPVHVGVNRLDPYEMKGTAELEDIINQPYLVVGATSGGLYNLMKYRPNGGSKVDWETKPFDLIVIDEASQMSLPEGVLVGAFLKDDGRMIIVGDHRQMPPIIAHEWKEEQKRSVTSTRPYISLFESLIERGFPCIALDESFRLHQEIAVFLRDNVYQRDGIPFHSRRKELVTQMPELNPYVDMVMRPEYPIVVIEHSEHGSQQFNQVELDLARPIIEACVNHLSLDGKNGIGVVVPHRAQKALLRAQFPSLAEVNSIDTVERFQGDERDVIIVSATASDPDYVRSEADFLLNLNRLNVAISRPKKKLIVIASQSVVDLLISDLEVFENSVIWKRLYYIFTPDMLYQWKENGVSVSVRGRKAFPS